MTRSTTAFSRCQSRTPNYFTEMCSGSEAGSYLIPASTQQVSIAEVRPSGDAPLTGIPAAWLSSSYAGGVIFVY